MNHANVIFLLFIDNKNSNFSFSVVYGQWWLCCRVRFLAEMYRCKNECFTSPYVVRFISYRLFSCKSFIFEL